MLPEEHTVDDLTLADDAAWVLASAPDGVAALLLRVDLGTGRSIVWADLAGDSRRGVVLRMSLGGP